MKFIRQYIWVFLLLFLVVDFVQSNYHYSNLPMDGDMARIAAPMKWYEDILKDPIGYNAITQNKKHAGAGRYVCHIMITWWFTDVYAVVQSVVKDRVHSLYYTSTLLVVLLHLSFLWLAFAYAKGLSRFNLKNFIPIALLASVFIQYNEFYDNIGIIDRSIVYVMAYALPIFSLLFYLLPIFKSQFIENYQLKIWQHLLLLIAAPLLAFSGALIQPIVFILFFLYLFGMIVPNPFYRVRYNKYILLQFIFLLTICIYAFYVSKYNSESAIYKSLSERYSLLYDGLIRIITLHPIWPVLIISLITNLVLIKYKEKTHAPIVKKFSYFVLAFCGIYILLLPLGGYRVYREYIIRYDTFIPVTLAFLFLLLFTTRILYQHFQGKNFLLYVLGLISLCTFLFIGDINTEREANYCEQGQLYEIIKSDELIIRKKYRCNVLMWDIRNIYDVENMKAVNIMLRKWGMIKEEQVVEFYE